MFSQSCFSAPSWGTMNSGSSGITLSCPGATSVAASMLWKYSVPSIASDPRRAVPAMDLPRTVILAAIQRDQHPPIEPAEHVEAAVDLPELLDGFGEHRTQQRRRGRIEHVADVVVGGDFGDTEKAGAVGSAVAFLQLALMRQERRALHEEHREGRHADVADAVGRVHAVALVREPVQAPSQ